MPIARHAVTSQELNLITIEYVLESRLNQSTGRKKDLTNINSLTGSIAKKPQGPSSLSIS
jgi:hypothetical protein